MLQRLNGTMTLGMAFLIYFYTQLISQPINAISHQIEDFQKASAGIVRIRELLSIESKLKDGPGVAFPPGALSLACENVSFGYGEAEMVIKNLSFRLEPGEVLGLLGRTAIIISHRRRTLQRAGTILLLDEGGFCEYGPRAQLANDSGSRFSQLLLTHRRAPF